MSGPTRHDVWFAGFSLQMVMPKKSRLTRTKALPSQSAAPVGKAVYFDCDPRNRKGPGTALIDNCPTRASRSGRSKAAFSLLELVAVIAIIAVTFGLLTSAMNAFTSNSGRAGAVNILMNTMEQARVAALESGRTVYVIFHRQLFPEQDAIMVLREPDPSSANMNYDQLTTWIKLPKGILLHQVGKGDLLGQDMPSISTFDPARSPASLTPVKSGEKFNVLAFSPSGGVSFPGVSPASKLMLILSEGVRGDGGTEAVLDMENAIGARKEAFGGFEIISLRRYTGRASLEVTTL